MTYRQFHFSPAQCALCYGLQLLRLAGSIIDLVFSWIQLSELATGVYSSYDQQVNNQDSCDFGGTGERQYILKNYLYAPLQQCLIYDDANPYDICGSMQWACGSGNTYADVSDSISTFPLVPVNLAYLYDRLNVMVMIQALSLYVYNM